MILAITFLLATGCSWFLLQPYWTVRGAQTGADRFDGSHDEEDRLRQMIKDLELDYATGKVANDEYERMKEAIIREASTVLAPDGRTKA